LQPRDRPGGPEPGASPGRDTRGLGNAWSSRPNSMVPNITVGNMVLVALYAASLAGVLRGYRWAYLAVVVVVLFSAGRVSGSAVGELAL